MSIIFKVFFISKLNFKYVCKYIIFLHFGFLSLFIFFLVAGVNKTMFLHMPSKCLKELIPEFEDRFAFYTKLSILQSNIVILVSFTLMFILTGITFILEIEEKKLFQLFICFFIYIGWYKSSRIIPDYSQITVDSDKNYQKVFSVFLFNTNFKTDSVILVNNSQRFARLVDIYKDVSVNKFDKVDINHFIAKIQYFEIKAFNEHYQAYLVDLSSEYDIVPLNNFAMNKTRKIYVKSNECYIVCPDYYNE